MLNCVDAETGKIVWEYEVDNPEFDANTEVVASGVCSTPVVIENFIYFVAPDATLHCIRSNGSEQPESIFKVDLNSEESDATVKCAPSVVSPVSHDDLIFVVSHAGKNAIRAKDGTHYVSSLIAIDRFEGKVVWKTVIRSQVRLPQYSSPSIVNTERLLQLVVAATDGWVYGFNIAKIKQGKPALVWKFNARRYESNKELPLSSSSFVASPVVEGNKVYIATGGDPQSTVRMGVLWCINCDGIGDLSPFIRAGNGNEEFRKNPNSGVVWKIVPETGMSGCIANAVVASSRVLQVTHSGILFCLNSKTGDVVWKRDLQSDVWGTPLVIAKKLFVATEIGVIHVFDDFQTNSKSRTLTIDGSIYTTPSASNEHLFFVGRGDLFAFKKKKKEPDKTK